MTMIKRVYFLNHDNNMDERQSDGVEFCVIPEFNDNEIYFYCSEYSLFWSSIEDVGDFDKCLKIQLTNKIRPATLVEICERNLYKHIDSIKEYSIDNGKVVNINYIYLKD